MTDTMIVGGLCDTMFKYDMGARLQTPSELIVDMNAMGRGV